MTDQKFVLVRQAEKSVGSKPSAGESKAALSLTPDASALEQKALVVARRARALGRRISTRRANKKSKKKGSVPNLPPSIDRVTVCSVVRRMAITNNAANQLVTRLTLASTIGGIVTVANTTVSLIASSYKLHKIIIWPSAGSTVTVDTLTGGTAEQALQRESLPGADMPTGITVDKPVVYVPPKGSYLTMWQTTNSNPGDGLLQISGAAGAIVDVHLSFTMFTGIGAVCPTAVTTSTVPLGDMVYMPLDTGNKVTVVALNGANH